MSLPSFGIHFLLSNHLRLWLLTLLSGSSLKKFLTSTCVALPPTTVASLLLSTPKNVALSPAFCCHFAVVLGSPQTLSTLLKLLKNSPKRVCAWYQTYRRSNFRVKNIALCQNVITANKYSGKFFLLLDFASHSDLFAPHILRDHSMQCKSHL